MKERSYAFGLRTIKLYKHLSGESKEYVLSKQILRSGTSIGANINGSESRRVQNGLCPQAIHCTQEADENGILAETSSRQRTTSPLAAESLLTDLFPVTAVTYRLNQ
jgi:four helix bundle protein